jgi:thioredoxin 1
MISITNENQVPKNGTQIIYFTSENCEACNLLTPKLSRLVENKGYRNWYSIDVNKVQSLGEQFKVEFIPTVIVLQDGKEVRRATGIKNIEYIGI